MNSILVIKLGAFGDFVQALGAMRAIRRAHAGDFVTLLTGAPYAALARASGYADTVQIDERPKWYRPDRRAALQNWFNAQHFARVYDLQNSNRTHRYFSLFKDRPSWNGTAPGADLHLPDDAARKSLHVFDALRAQLALAGITSVEADDLSWMEADLSRFSLPARYALLVPGSSPGHEKKRWPAPCFAALGQWMTTRGVTPVLIGTSVETEAIAAIGAAIGAALPAAVNLCGKTSLFDLAALARGAVCTVGNDTGPVQLAGPTGCKTIALFPGFSNPARHKPLGAQVHCLQEKRIADIPLFRVLAVCDAWF